MPFLILLAAMFGFSFFLPKTFKVFYALFMALVFTLGPAGFVSIILSVMGINIPFSLVCAGCFIFVAVPFIAATMPGNRFGSSEEDEEEAE